MDYHGNFGIKCDHCEKFITGRVLEVKSMIYLFLKMVLELWTWYVKSPLSMIDFWLLT